MEFSRKNTGVGCHFLLQGILPTQGSNPGLLPCRRILYQTGQPWSPALPEGSLPDRAINVSSLSRAYCATLLSILGNRICLVIPLASENTAPPKEHPLGVAEGPLAHLQRWSLEGSPRVTALLGVVEGRAQLNSLHESPSLGQSSSLTSLEPRSQSSPSLCLGPRNPPAKSYKTITLSLRVLVPTGR